MSRTAKRARENGASIKVSLESMNYRVIDWEASDIESTPCFTCTYEQVKLTGCEGSYRFHVRRYNVPEEGFSADLIYYVDIHWLYEPTTQKDFDNPISSVKSIIAPRASLTLAAITNETFMVPMITQPFFDGDEEPNDETEV